MHSEKEEHLLLAKLGERIRKLRIEEGYSNQEAFAYASDIPRAQYGRYEKGTNLTIVSLYRVLKRHQITFEEFFGDGFAEVNKAMKEK
jgi:transcriptional regulator with XRE-family HTH domain